MTYILMDFQAIYDQMDFNADDSLKPTLIYQNRTTVKFGLLFIKLIIQIVKKTYSTTIQTTKYNTIEHNAV